MDMEPLKAIIVDDEELARQLIRNYLKDVADIEIIAECENGFDGVKAISEQKPDLVFLDIQMPKINGFEMLELIDNPPEIIFITAHNEFAIRAFEMNAVDYLLKPYSKDRLVAAVQKVKERLQTETARESVIPKLIQQPLTEKLERIVVKSGTKIKVVPVEKIVYLEAEDDYVMIHTDEGKHLKQGTMRYYEDHLDPSRFVRVHRSYIVKIDQVTQLEPYSRENYLLKLKNGVSLKVSRNGLKSLKDRFDF
jgi:two-component system, LytTR family, response regulator